MATTTENLSNPTPGTSTPNATVKNAEKSEKKNPEVIPIYEIFRYESQTNNFSPLRKFVNNLLHFQFGNKEESVKVANKNGSKSKADTKKGKEPVEKIDSEPAHEVYGFDYQVLWLVRLLVKPEKEDFKRIGVVGMPHVGKSDLGRLIFNHESVKQHFAPRIWVPMSKKSTKDVVIHILKEVDVDQELIEKWGKGSEEADNNIQADSEAEKKGVDALRYALNLKLVGKRYLIILDDVNEWTDNDAPAAGTEKVELVCDPFKFGFPKESGGAVLVTSRNKSVVKGMVGDNIYTPQPIKNADSSWDIYNSVLETKIETPTEDLKNEFKKKSGGLPVAARLMGRIKNNITGNRGAEINGSNKTENGGVAGTNGSNKTENGTAGTDGNNKTEEDGRC